MYDKVRVKTDDIGWKLRIKSLWPVGGLWGIWKAIKSGDFLLHRAAAWKWGQRGGGVVGVGVGEERKEKAA